MINWTPEKRKVKDLIPADYNPRKISDKERADLKESIEHFGKVMPVIINTKNTIIGGHQRISIYADMGQMDQEIIVMVPSRELTEKEERELNLRLNKNMASWDWEKLQTGFDIDTLLSVGFGDEELASYWDDVDLIDDLEAKGGGRENEEVVPRAKFGEIYILGNHRLMLGDSTNPEMVEKLMAGDKADMVYCDPPYNIGLDYNSGIGTNDKYGGSYSKNGGDLKKDADYSQFVKATMTSAKSVAKKNAHFF